MPNLPNNPKIKMEDDRTELKSVSASENSKAIGIENEKQNGIHIGGCSIRISKDKTKAEINLSSLLSKTEIMRGPVWLETIDGELEELEREVALLSPYIQREVIRHGLGSSAESPVLLPKQVNLSILELILKYCRFHRVPGRSDKERKIFDEKFVRLDTRKLCELTSAADSLDMKPLVDLTSRALARMIEGKSPEEIRETFHLPDDLTEEEKLEPVKNATDDPRIRLLNRLYARKRKELQERKIMKINNESESKHHDDRSVDELLSFIDGDNLDQKNVKCNKTKKKKKNKKKDSNVEQQNGSISIPNSNSNSVLDEIEDSAFSKEMQKQMGNGNGNGKNETMVKSKSKLKPKSNNEEMEMEMEYDDGIDPALKEKLDKEVEDFERRLNIDWHYRKEEILALATSSSQDSLNLDSAYQNLTNQDLIDSNSDILDLLPLSLPDTVSFSQSPPSSSLSVSHPPSFSPPLPPSSSSSSSSSVATVVAAAAATTTSFLSSSSSSSTFSSSSSSSNPFFSSPTSSNHKRIQKSQKNQKLQKNQQSKINVLEITSNSKSNNAMSEDRAFKEDKNRKVDENRKEDYNRREDENRKEDEGGSICIKEDELHEHVDEMDDELAREIVEDLIEWTPHPSDLANSNSSDLKRIKDDLDRQFSSQTSNPLTLSNSTTVGMNTVSDHSNPTPVYSLPVHPPPVRFSFPDANGTDVSSPSLSSSSSLSSPSWSMANASSYKHANNYESHFIFDNLSSQFNQNQSQGQNRNSNLHLHLNSNSNFDSHSSHSVFSYSEPPFTHPFSPLPPAKKPDCESLSSLKMNNFQMVSTFSSSFSSLSPPPPSFSSQNSLSSLLPTNLDPQPNSSFGYALPTHLKPAAEPSFSKPNAISSVSGLVFRPNLFNGFDPMHSSDPPSLTSSPKHEVRSTKPDELARFLQSIVHMLCMDAHIKVTTIGMDHASESLVSDRECELRSSVLSEPVSGPELFRGGLKIERRLSSGVCVSFSIDGGVDDLVPEPRDRYGPYRIQVSGSSDQSVG